MSKLVSQSVNKKNIKTISPISIDLGAKSTGVSMFHYQSGDCFSDIHANRHDFVVYSDVNKTYSQVSRRQNRHSSRNIKRRKMAKRLLWLILEDQYGVSINNKIKLSDGQSFFDFINGILNRRGFNYIQSKCDEDLIAKNWNYIHDYLTNYFENEVKDFEDFKNIITKDVKQLSRILDLHIFKIDKDSKKINAYHLIKSDERIDDSLKVEVFDTINEFKNYVIENFEFYQSGHLHRSRYFENIKEDIDSFFKLNATILKSELSKIDQMGSIKLYNLMGNISNLQLRILRKYFNNPEYKKEARFENDRLYKYLLRYFRALRYSKEQIDVRNEVQKILDLNKNNGLNVLLELNPNLSIPPYEDQDNRRPPKCQSLKFNLKKLNDKYPDWPSWLSKLLKDEKVYQVVFDGDNYFNKENNKEIILQRIFDTNSLFDVFKLRKLCKLNESSLKSSEEYQKLKSILGMAVDNFLKLGTQYFTETMLARNSTWFESSPDNILQACNLNPPRKSSQFSELLEAVVGKKIDVDLFVNFIRSNSYERSTFESIIQKCFKLQSDYGSEVIANIIRQLNNPTKLKLKKESSKKDYISEIQNLYIKSQYVSSALRSEFKIDRELNIFLLMQIYSHLFNDVRGFSKTCRSCTNDNLYRMQTIQFADQTGAKCSRLPADSIRPFDGFLARLLEDNARIIAAEKINQIKSFPPIDEIILPIVIEENHFESLLELSALKQSSNTDKFKKKHAFHKTDFADKISRIKKSNISGICPYTGKFFKNGQIDHIIPRAHSLKINQQIYNSEANLIYVSTEGNTLKSNKTITIQQINKKYLESIFGTSNIEQIKEHLIDQIEKFQSGELPITEFIQVARHALFYDDLRQKVEIHLRSGFATRVNGTQGWLVKRIVHQLQNQLNVKITPCVFYVDSKDVSLLRYNLQEEFEKYTKPDIQPAYSHVIDSHLAFVAAVNQQSLFRIDDFDTVFCDIKKIEKTLPKRIDIQKNDRRAAALRTNLSSFKLFKQPIAVRYVPFVGFKNGEVGFGFGLGAKNKEKNYTSVKTNMVNKMVATIWPYLVCNEKNHEEFLKNLKLQNKEYKFLKINKKKADMFLADKNSSDENVRTILNLIRYETKKQDVFGLDQKRILKYLSLEKINEKDIAGKIKFKNSVFFHKSELTLPDNEKWLKLINSPVVQKLFGQEVSLEQLGQLHEEFIRLFGESESKFDRQHSDVKKIYSLPMIAGSSGRKIWINRKNVKNENVVQFYPAEVIFINGVNVDSSGKIIGASFNKKIIESKVNLVEPIAQPGHFLPLREWVEMPLNINDKKNGISKLELQYATDDRCNVRLTLSIDTLKKWTHIADSSIEKFEIKQKYSKESSKIINNFYFDSYDESLQPRENYSILSYGDFVTILFVNYASNSTWQKHLVIQFLKNKGLYSEASSG